jgi:hypothetical protein
MERDIQTDIQSDMAFFFLRMRLLASPFGLAIIYFEIGISAIRDLGEENNLFLLHIV